MDGYEDEDDLYIFREKILVAILNVSFLLSSRLLCRKTRSNGGNNSDFGTARYCLFFLEQKRGTRRRRCNSVGQLKLKNAQLLKDNTTP